MKIKTIETIVQTNKYEAYNGTLFDDVYECEKYESTAEAIILLKYNKLITHSYTECQLFNCGSDDFEFQFVTAKTEEQKDIVRMTMKLYNTLSDNAESIIASNDDIIIGYAHYDDNNHYVIGSRSDILYKLTSKFNGDK